MLSKDKISFVLYTSFYEAVRDLPLDRKGMLLDIIFQYENGDFDEQRFGELPPEVKMAFGFIRRNLDKDHAKWQETLKSRSAAGKAGANARWQTKQPVAGDEPACDGMAKPAVASGKMANDGKRIKGMAKMPVYVDVDENVNDNNVVVVVKGGTGGSAPSAPTTPTTKIHKFYVAGKSDAQCKSWLFNSWNRPAEILRQWAAGRGVGTDEEIEIQIELGNYINKARRNGWTLEQCLKAYGGA